MTAVVSRLLAIAHLTMATVPVMAAEPEGGLTLQEGLTLPPAELARRALGITGARYLEVRRPYLGGVPGRIGFNLWFAAMPRPASFPGLCQADTIDLYFGPTETSSSANDAMQVYAVRTETLYKIVGDTAPATGTGGSTDHESVLAELCMNAGPVFADPNLDGPHPHFFGGRESGAPLSPPGAYFAARALQLAVEAAESETLRQLTCEEDRSTPHVRTCTNPRATMTNLRLDLVNGFDIEPCSARDPELCVTAGFSRARDGTRYGILQVVIRTNASEVGGRPRDFQVVSVSMENSTVVE